MEKSGENPRKIHGKIRTKIYEQKSMGKIQTKNLRKNPWEKSGQKSTKKSTGKIREKNPEEKSTPSQIRVSNIHQQKIYEKYPVSNKYPTKYPCMYDRQAR